MFIAKGNICLKERLGQAGLSNILYTVKESVHKKNSRLS